MTPWADGYVSDIRYVGGVYGEQMPAHLNTVCLVAGVAPPAEPAAPFNYCELGCGLGETAMVVAAAYPEAHVWGFDFNPAHIAQARAVATLAGLDNLVFAERSFEELVEAPAVDLPEMDYVAVHGVWSWVSPANRAHIVAFLRKQLRPGGLLCLSYNAMPGWSGTIGLQHLLFAMSRCVGGGSGNRLQEAVALARRVNDLGPPGASAKRLEQIESMLAQGHIPYLTHEYLNAHWSPEFSDDVARALAPAKLGFVGSASMLEHFPELCMKPEQRALVDSLPADMQQTVRDHLCARTFRRDVFIKGIRPLHARERHDRLATQRLALVVPETSATRRIVIPVGEATLNEAFYAPVLARLGQVNETVGELAAAAAPGTVPDLREVVGMLVGSGQVLPAPGAIEPHSLARVRRYNRSQIGVALDEGRRDVWLASSLLGSAIHVGFLEMLVYEGAAALVTPDEPSGESILTSVQALMSGRGLSPHAEGHDLTRSRAAAEAAIKTIIADRLPLWRRTGVL